MLFGLITLPMTKKMFRDMDILQRKMLRRIVGWRRNSNESWETTMSRMKERMQRAQYLYHYKAWTTTYAKLQ